MKTLETSGFHVIRNFLDTFTLEKLKSEFNSLVSLNKLSQNENSDYFKKFKNQNYNFSLSNLNIAECLLPLIKDISDTTDIKLNCFMVSNGHYIATNNINFPWHIDHETYYLWKDSYSSVAFWMPIVKPRPTISGLSLIPQYVWEEKYPYLYHSRIKGRGAKRIITIDNKTYLSDDDLDEKILLDDDILELSVTPELSPGDVLIFRNDVFHKTQDILDDRCALVIRAYNKNTILYKDILMNRNKIKQSIIDKNPVPYQLIERYFEEHNCTECTIGDYIKSSNYYNRKLLTNI